MKKEILSTMGEVEDVLSELYESSDDDRLFEEEISVELSDDCSIFVYSRVRVVIDSLQLELREGLACNLEDDEWTPDWSATVIYEKNAGLENWDYYEQDGMLTSLHNYLTMLERKTETSIYDIPCKIVIE